MEPGQFGFIQLLVGLLIFMFVLSVMQDGKTFKYSVASLPQKLFRRGSTSDQWGANPYSVRHFYTDTSYSDVPDWIVLYLKFHNENVIWKKENQAYSLRKGAKYLRYSCNNFFRFCGGIGDRFNGIITLFYMALLSNRVLILESTKPYPLEDFMVHGRVKWNVQDYPRSNEMKLSAFGQKQDFDFLRDPCLLKVNAVGIDISINSWTGNFWETECMKSYLNKHAKRTNSTNDNKPKRHLYRWAFWSLFGFTNAVLDCADDIRLGSGIEAVFLDKHQHHPLFAAYHALHIRTGNVDTSFLHGALKLKFSTGATEYRFTKNQADLEKAASCSKRLRNSTKSFLGSLAEYDMQATKNLTTFVISDSDKAKRTIHNFDPGNIKYGSTTIQHIDSSIPLWLAQFHRKNYQGALDTYAEWVILLESECLLRSRSGYSEVPHKISISNEVLFDRCGVQFRECEDFKVAWATDSIYWNE